MVIVFFPSKSVRTSLFRGHKSSISGPNRFQDRSSSSIKCLVLVEMFMVEDTGDKCRELEAYFFKFKYTSLLHGVGLCV